MTKRQVIATAVALAVMGSSTPTTLMAASAQQKATLSGTAKDEAKKPFNEFTVQVRNVSAPGGPIAGSIALDPNGNFSLAGLTPSKYVVELLNKKGKLVCTEGPYDLTAAPMAKNDVVIDCNHVPVAWWLLAAAGAAAITAGIVTGGPSSASQ